VCGTYRHNGEWVVAYYKIVLKGNIDEQELVNVFYFEWVDPTTLNVISSFINDYLDRLFIDSGLLGALSNRVHYHTWQAYLRVGGDWVDDASGAWEHAGGVSSDSLPNQSAAVIIGKVRGWRGFGRKFFAGVAEGNQSAGNLSNDFLLLLADAAVAYVADLFVGVVGLRPGIFSKDGVFRPFFVALVDVLVGSQRRRKPGVGR
jgi:hypothetical protein